MSWGGIISAWLPLVLLGGVLIWLSLRHQSDLRGKSGLTHGQYLEEILNETRAHNARLEKIIQRMDERIAAIEKQGNK